MFKVLKSVLRHFAIYGFGTILNRVIGFVLIPVYTNYLSTADYGTLELIEITTMVAGMFLTAGISYGVFRFYFDTDEVSERRLVVSTAHMSIWGLAVLLGLWFILFSPSVSKLVFRSPDNASLLRLAFTTLILAVVSEVPMAYIRAEQRSALYITISAIRLALGLSLNILFLIVLGWSVKGIILSALITQIATTLFVSVYTFVRTGFGMSVSRLKQMMRYGLPYIPGAIGVYILNFADRYLLPRFSSMSDLGVYALGYKFGMVMGPLVTEPFMAIWGPQMFELSKKPDAPDIYAKMFTYFMLLQFTVGIGICLVIRDVLTVMSAADFHGAYTIVPYIVLSYIAWGACGPLRIGMLLAKKTKYIAYVMGGVGLANVALNLVLIPPFGMWGAAFATLISYSLVFALQYRISSQFLTINYEWHRLSKLLLAAVLTVLLSYFIGADSPWVSIVLKGSCIGIYPVLLWAMDFLSAEERSKLRDLAEEALRRLRR